MKNKLNYPSGLLVLAFLLAGCSPEASPAAKVSLPESTEATGEMISPAVEVLDQEIANGSVTIPTVSLAADGWVVIHTINEEGKPGSVIGYAPAPAGTSNNITVEIDEAQVTPKLFAMLHVDAGIAGTYEFPGDDTPVMDGDAVVVKPFNLNGLNPFVRASDQSIQDGAVMVDAAYMTQAGWVVIHTANEEGKPGPVIGNAAIPEGYSTNIQVPIDSENATPKLFAMLHIDAGIAGTYEFPGDDIPVSVGDAIVLTPFDTEVALSSIGVRIANFSFGPNELEIKVGTTVTWTNEDSVAHTATSDDGSFDSGSLRQGSSYSFTFSEPGTFSYICTFHPSMTGTITVLP